MVGYILLAILLLLIIVLLFPVKIHAAFAEELELKVSFLFLKMQILPKQPKKEKKKKAKSEEQQESRETENNQPARSNRIVDSVRSIIQSKGIKGFLGIIYAVLNLIMHYTGVLLHHVKLRKLDVYIRVSSDNAADTALDYAKYCSVLYPAISEISSFFHCRKPLVTIDFDYDAESVVCAEGSISLRLIILIGIVLKLIIKVLPDLLKLRPKRKVVKNNGRSKA